MASSSTLFQPIRVGSSQLKHRVVLAPLTRLRANKSHVHGELAVKYYGQRAAEPGTLLVTEATFIAAQAGGNDNVPGIWSDEQIAAWKKVTDAVHAQGSFIYLQLWALGRAADPEILIKEGNFDYVSSSASRLKGIDKDPRPLTVSEIHDYIELYAKAASNAVHRAGFDGVEVHGANGYLIDQFFQDTCNSRTDEYGGSIENRARFGLEVVNKVVETVGAQRTGIRLSPWSKFQGMRMVDPIPTFSYVVTELSKRHPDLAYVHLVEPAISAGDTESDVEDNASNDFIRKIWAPRPLISAGAFTPSTAPAHADKAGDLIAFGRYFISNPDLPKRIREGIALTPYNRATFYLPEKAEGYTDYPTADESSG